MEVKYSTISNMPWNGNSIKKNGYDYVNITGGFLRI